MYLLEKKHTCPKNLSIQKTVVFFLTYLLKFIRLLSSAFRFTCHMLLTKKLFKETLSSPYTKERNQNFEVRMKEKVYKRKFVNF